MAKKILIIEDEISILDLLLAVFECEGYELLSANNGEEGLKISREENPDILILDNRLPDIDGIEVCTSLKSDPTTSHTRVLMLSGMAQSSDIQKAYEAKVDAYMTKPFRIETLVGKVEELLKN